MKKIPTIFQRNPFRKRIVIPDQNPQCKWVFDGEGVATRKYDGSCCMVKDGKMWKRREVKKGAPMPSDFVKVDHDKATGKTVGWVPVTDNPEDRWHRDAFGAGDLQDGTYELCGPKVNGNNEKYDTHILIMHENADKYDSVPRSFDELYDLLEVLDIEGFVFHHPDGRMAKIKKRDFGLKRVP